MQNNENSLKRLSFEHALLPSGWASDVAVEINGLGTIVSIDAGRKPDRQSSGCLVPGIVNLHSHAHQRAMAGLAERAGDSADSFWSWRNEMYRFLEVIKPQHLHAIASQLYVEMLKVGYTRVAEFQYLHHQFNGAHYDNIAEMSLQTLSAACDVGIGITNLPVLYQYSGFGGKRATTQQRRFVNTTDDFQKIIEILKTEGRAYENTNTGIAAHSLRAVTRESFGEVLHNLADQTATPVHIHIAEQMKEVHDCISFSGTTPVAYLYDHFHIDQRWCLVHATHMTDVELNTVANSGAIVGLCPTTEANLGDGVFNTTTYLSQGGMIGIGSDSHISISITEELRWLEYEQRLQYCSRNQLSGGNNMSTGRNLFNLAMEGGAQACAHKSGRIEEGYQADFIVLDTEHVSLCERSGDEIIDSWIFSGNQNLVRDVYVSGRQVISQGRHENQEAIESDFKKTMAILRALR